MVVRCAASDPDLYPGQPARVATWELEASGGLTVEVGWGAVGFGCPRQIRNHHTLTPVWEPWGSPPFNYPQVPFASNMPRWISLRREKPRQTTRLPGGGSLARAR